MGNFFRIASPQITSTGGPANSSAVLIDTDFPGRVELNAITVHGATAHSSTVVVQVDATSTGDWRDLIEENSTNPVKIPGGGARPLPSLSAPRMRLQSRGGEASTRTFRIFTQ